VRRPAAVPYSIEDRRMTIAVLPFDVPEQDAAGSRVAAEAAGTIYTELQSDVDWVQVVPRQLAEDAAKKHAANHALAQELNVHFLIRGTVSRAADGYRVELRAIDGQSDRTLQSETVAVPVGAVTLRSQWDVSKALYKLVFASVTAEADRVRDRPVDALDVRDLTFRASVDWRRTHQGATAKGAYAGATELLNRALALAPDDPLALQMTARVNLCDCVNAWSKDPKVQQAIGAEATEKLLHKHPGSADGLFLKEKIYVLQGRYEEALLTLEALPAVKDIGDTVGYLDDKCSVQLKLGKPQDALATCKQLAEITGGADQADILAAIYFELGDYEKAAHLARETVVQLNQATVGHPIFGAIALTLVAAEARLGHLDRAKAAFADFKVAVPAADSISAIRKWINPRADLAGYEPLYEGLKLAGIRD
jgi:TolB-like protein